MTNKRRPLSYIVAELSAYKKTPWIESNTRACLTLTIEALEQIAESGT